MSIKKDIENMLANGGRIRKWAEINGISYLYRSTEDWDGNPCDNLEIHFQYVGGIKGGKNYEIKARDYEGILAEVAEATRAYMSECAEEMIKNMQNGHR